MSDKHPIDELFRQGLEEHSIEPSEKAWTKIEAATQSKGASAGLRPGHLLRAAAVTLLIGLSSLLYFYNHEESISTPQGEKGISVQPDKPGSGNDTPPSAGAAQPNKTEPGKKEEPTKKTGNKTKAGKPVKKSVPVLKRGSTGGNLRSYVYEEAEWEESFAQENMPALEEVALNPARVAELDKPKVSIKLRYTRPVSGDWAAETQAQKEKQKDLKDKIFAYANNQFNNLKAGKGLELPEAPKGKPQLEINLDKIF